MFKRFLPPVLRDVSALSGFSSGYNVAHIEEQRGEHIYWAACVHHCGSAIRCATRIHVVGGRVVRITSDDDELDFKGNVRDKELWTDTRALACCKCRSYKFRLNHPGRLKYPLMQTKRRGDLSGFVQIPAERALNEIARKYRAIFSKYGAGAIYDTHAPSAGDGGTFNMCHPARDALTNYIGGTRNYSLDYSFHQFYYAMGLTGYPDAPLPWDKGVGNILPDIAGVAKNLILWGSNTLTTNNPLSYPFMRTVELMKERCETEGSGGRVMHISPEFSDTGVTLATDWVQLRNYTDAALIMALLYEMIVNTFDSDGNIMPAPWLDVNYIDTFVYGFFDSPEYWVMTDTGSESAGQISLTPRRGKGWVRVDAVPAGGSLSAYIMGGDDRLRKARYKDGGNYTARRFSRGNAYRNMSGCSLRIKGVPACECSPEELRSSIYMYKRDLMTPKTPEWAEAICGTPADTIRELARIYSDTAEHPIVNEWSGGLQKSDNGVPTMWAILSLLCVTKSFGASGEGLYGSWGSRLDNSGEVVAETLNPDLAIPSGRPSMAAGFGDVPPISIKEWSNSVKLAFFDELRASGYTGRHIPGWDMKDRFLYDDGGVKTGVVWKRDEYGNITEFFDKETNKFYYDYERNRDGSPIYAGTRMIINPSGSMQMNQHFNTNDTAEMYRNLPLASPDPDDPDTYCFVTFDNFMTPASRYADYILPSTISLEAGDWTPVGDTPLYRPPVASAPGEAKDGWRWAYEAYLAQVRLGDFEAKFGDKFVYRRKVDPDAHLKYVGTAFTTGLYQSAEDVSMRVVDEARTNPSSRFYNMTREEVFAEQFQPRAQQQPEITQRAERSDLREMLDAYLNLPDDERISTPFVYNGEGTSVRVDAAFIGNKEDDIAGDMAGRPGQSGRFHVYNGACVWDYERRYSKYHGWLPPERRGQRNKDREGDPIVLPIPIYWNFEDSFNEAYGVFDGKNAQMRDGLTMGTSHDRFRTHSTLSENPFLRELSHRTAGGGWASGNDWLEYAVSASGAGMISKAIQERNREAATWPEVWMNYQDAAARGIADGDLVKLENPIGAVRAVARVTVRCVRGHINLHQGAWYDPNPTDGVDDGGCANTLMSSQCSRYDHGNAQQMAMVRVSKVEDFFTSK